MRGERGRISGGCYTLPVSERDATETVAAIEIERPVTDPEIALAVPQAPEPDEPGNPDSWLQWALVVGLLALFLICALLILIGWNGR
jgi:hypothetical protein